jgi:hypothetical protein
VLLTMQRLHPEILSSADLVGRFTLSRSQIGSILQAQIAAGLIRRLGKGSGSRYIAAEPAPLNRRPGIRPRRLGFREAWLVQRRVRVPEVLDDEQP